MRTQWFGLTEDLLTGETTAVASYIGQVGSPGIMATARLSDSSSYSVDSTSYVDCPWDTEVHADEDITPGVGSDDSLIQLDSTSPYSLDITLSLLGTTTDYHYQGQLVVNVWDSIDDVGGAPTEVLAPASFNNYIGADGGDHTKTSLHLSFVHEFVAGNVIQVQVKRISSLTGNGVTVAGESHLSIIRLTGATGPAGYQGVDGADSVQTALDVIATNADVVTTAANVALTAADVISTAANAASTAADVISTNADVVATNADVLITNQDAIDTAADVVLTNADVVLTNADAASTAQDAIDTAADLVATNQDTIDTAADAVSTAADVISAEDSNLESGDWANQVEDSLTRTFSSGTPTNRAAGNYSALHWAAKAAADAILTAADVVLTNADVVSTNADAAATAQDSIDTNNDKIAAAASAADAAQSAIDAGMNWRGNWATSTAYAVSDAIYNSGSGSYICISAHTSGDTDDEPGVGATEATYWEMIAADAATGVSATESVSGIAEIATQTETDAGTDDERFITPLKLENSAINTAVALNTAKVTNATHTGDVTGSGALTIAAGAVSLAKMAAMATASFLGRTTAGSGDPEVLTKTQALAILNVEDGATADQSDGEIKTAYENNADTNAYTDAEVTKVGHLTVTQAVDLDQMETDIAALSDGMTYNGDWDASSGSFPTGADKGGFYYVTVGGTVDSVEFSAGDNLVAIVDSASTTVFAANWSKHDQTDAVSSVVGLVGSITKSGLLTALNVEDGADVTDAVNVGSSIAGATTKTTPVDADGVGLIDSAASNSLKFLSWVNIKATLKTYFDSVSTTLTNKTLTSPVLNTGVSGTAILDEDDMSSDSATQLATQQSIKAYIEGIAVQLRKEAIQLFVGGDNYSTTDDYTFVEYAPYSFDIDSVVCRQAVGTSTFTVKIDGVTVTGLSAVSSSTSEQTHSASALNSVAVGERVTVEYASLDSTDEDIAIQLNMTRTDF